MDVGFSIHLQKSAQWLVLGIVSSIPIVFGAVHPLFIGFYTFLMLVGLGGWLLLNLPECSAGDWSIWSLAPFFLVFYLVVQSIPLPPEIVEILSPHRLERVSMVNLLAGTDQKNITLSENGIAGLYRATFLLALLFYYHSVRTLLRIKKTFLTSLVLCIVAIGVLEALYGLVQFVSPQIGILWLSVKGRAAHGTIIYKNQYASLLNMIWPLALSSCVSFFLTNRKKSGARRSRREAQSVSRPLADTKLQAVLYLFAAGAMWLAVLFSLSRGGILAMVFVVLLLTLMLPFSTKKKLVGLSCFLLFVCSYGTMLGLDTVVSRFNSIGNSGAIRFDIYVSSLPMLVDHWLTGIGLGAYTLLSPVYLKGFPENLHFDRVHNEYLELLIELGVPVASLLFVWIFAGLAKILRAIMVQTRAASIDYTSALIGMSAFCGLVGFLIHGVVDFGWRLPANLVYATTLLAIIKSCFDDASGIGRVRKIVPTKKMKKIEAPSVPR
ncbi:MAG: hypothetical protein COA36_07815 [Desulfotalea sp.]|nr:MAG: hypothetical protein COA36_07815 [Desulfotalea sp.]